jgi:hypothetical protein
MDQLAQPPNICAGFSLPRPAKQLSCPSFSNPVTTKVAADQVLALKTSSTEGQKFTVHQMSASESTVNSSHSMDANLASCGQDKSEGHVEQQSATLCVPLEYMQIDSTTDRPSSSANKTLLNTADDVDQELI